MLERDRFQTVLNSLSFEINVFHCKFDKDEIFRINFVRYVRNDEIVINCYLIQLFVNNFVWEIVISRENCACHSTIRCILSRDFFLVVLMTAFVTSSPAEKTKDTCQKSCGSDYTPVCGKPASGKGTNILFGNQCVLSNYNCEKKENRMKFLWDLRESYHVCSITAYEKAAESQCNDKTPVRL